MRIAFWSNVHGQTGTTSNMVAISIMSTLLYRKRSAMLQSHFDLNNLEIPLLGKKITGIENYDVGIDALTRDIKSAPLNEEGVVNASISLLNRQLNLIPSTSKRNRELYEKDMEFIFNRIVDEVQECHTNVFIDVCSGNSPLSMSILENADLIIVNLSQNKGIINEYFETYNFNNKKVMYLIGNYNRNSRYNMNNLIRMYPNFNKKNLVYIPYNVEYQDSQCEGGTIQFFLRNIDCNKRDKNFYFIDSVRKATHLICDRLFQEDIPWK
ncbi:hypothetical protein [Anaeromicropila herbilytica]|uniref:AAA domain-containing protein n=1 Tax=Anaeromicropila herbilytica TaxID=2785025 RepID=A0A7R7EPJ2_9FIRM|nr:hypothetical protein [Anaeromicropila herbilytica]BCN32416.1 hypothetical protein bsdtb5_37110 [Anaeromicropila herbilytica]